MCIRDRLGTFFSTPQGINTTMSGDKEALEGLVQLLKSKFKLNLLSKVDNGFKHEDSSYYDYTPGNPCGVQKFDAWASF